MKSVRPLFICTAAALLVVLLLVSCGGSKNEIFKREDLFPLKLGKMEDYLSFFIIDNHYSGGIIDFIMKDGLFYISNQDGNKVMKFNSYGDIISIIYNEEKNPVPVVLKRVSGDTVTNRLAYPYPFIRPGHIAVGSEKEILVQDEVPRERSIQDEKRQSIFDQVLLRFDSNGKLKDYLGQEGIGGTPFPYIERIQVNAEGDIIVFTRTINSWVVYWYDKEGRPLYTVNVEKSLLPQPKSEHRLIPSLEAMYADPQEKILYIKLDYYADSVDPSSQFRYGIIFQSSYLYSFDIRSETYANGFEIPSIYKSPEGLAIISEKKEKSVTEFLGAAAGGFLFMISPVGVSQYSLLILDKKGKVEESLLLQMKDDEQIFREFYLDPSGILCAMLCEENGAKMVWWRTDEIIARARDRQKSEK